MTSAGADPAGWGRDGVTRYELAEEILALLRTDSGRELRRAESADPVIPADVARAADAHRRYTELREGVHRLGPAEIEKIIAEYGPLARAAAGTIAP
jgi:predicted nucleic acid-binding protein